MSTDFGWPPLHIRAELDGNLWFTQGGQTPSEHLDNGRHHRSFIAERRHVPDDMTLGLGGWLWFTGPGTSSIARLRKQPRA